MSKATEPVVGDTEDTRFMARCYPSIHDVVGCSAALRYLRWILYGARGLKRSWPHSASWSRRLPSLATAFIALFVSVAITLASFEFLVRKTLLAKLV